MAILSLFLFSFIDTTSGALIFADGDLQAAVDEANPGDTVVVSAGQYEPFTVDKTLIVRGINSPVVSAQIQTPAISINADGVTLSGFTVVGVPEDSEAKFDYYMDISNRKPHYKLNFQNAAVLVDGEDVVVEDIEVTRAEVGVLANGVKNVTLRNDTFQRCETGLQLHLCRDSKAESCRFDGCENYGIYVERSMDISLACNEIANTSSMGIMLKSSTGSLAEENDLYGNWEGLVLWNSTFCELRENRAQQNLYYGIVVASSTNNTILDNLARNNGGGEYNLLGTGISLVDNSSHNLVARNDVEGNLNGLEITKDCQFNLICCNNASNNSNGIRLDKNQNNLIYRNNFRRNQVSAYDNASHNFWNATVGNYYDDYRGIDEDGDGVGDDPYWIPKGSSCAVDWRPLVQPAKMVLDPTAAKEHLRLYARYQPEEHLPYRIENQTIVIESRKPTKWWV